MSGPADCDLLVLIGSGDAVTTWARRIDRRLIGALAASTAITMLLVGPYLYRAI